MSIVLNQGQLSSAHAMSPNSAKVQAVMDLKPPKDIKQLKLIMGLVNYLARYAPHLVTTVQPMFDLLKSDQTFTWDASQRKVFEKVKLITSNRHTLEYCDINRPTFVSADVSTIALGACIFQEIDGSTETSRLCITSSDRHREALVVN